MYNRCILFLTILDGLLYLALLSYYSYRDVVDIKHSEVFYTFDLLPTHCSKENICIHRNSLYFSTMWMVIVSNGSNFPLSSFCPTNGKHRFLCVSIIHETISMMVKNNKNVAPLSLILTVAKIHEMPISRLRYNFINHHFQKHLHQCYIFIPSNYWMLGESIR